MLKVVNDLKWFCSICLLENQNGSLDLTGLASFVTSYHLNRLFKKKKIDKKECPKQTEKVQKISLLNVQRAQNVCILLPRVKYPAEIIKQKLVELEFEAFSVEDIQRIEQIIPTAEEDEKFKVYFQSGKNLRGRQFSCWLIINGHNDD